MIFGKRLVDGYRYWTTYYFQWPPSDQKGPTQTSTPSEANLQSDEDIVEEQPQVLEEDGGFSSTGDPESYPKSSGRSEIEDLT
jgi:hypothetical protein